MKKPRNKIIKSFTFFQLVYFIELKIFDVK